MNSLVYTCSDWEEIVGMGGPYFWRAILCHTDIAGGDTSDLTLFIVENFGRGNPRVDLDTELFSLFSEPRDNVSQSNDIIPMIVHRQTRNNGDPNFRGIITQDVEKILLYFGIERSLQVSK